MREDSLKRKFVHTDSANDGVAWPANEEDVEVLKASGWVEESAPGDSQAEPEKPKKGKKAAE